MSKWTDKIIRPEEYRDIVVLSKDGKEHDNHYWNGGCYYEYIRWKDNTCDGYPSDVEIVSWRYK